jgi:KDO2-lipid IV(A) lauroyltransferase
MYYLLYTVLYTLSLIPWRIMYTLSDGAYLLLYHVFKYRRKVVMANLLIAFPEKTEGERIKIAKEFYHNFLDTFIETLKFLSISDRDFCKRISGNFEIFENLYQSGQNVQIHSGHFFNWEYMNWAVPKFAPYPFIGVYAPVANKAFNKIILEMRQRYQSIMLSATDFKTSFHQLSKGRYALGLYADQSPPNISQSFWVSFFGKLTPFVAGPEKSARINNTAVVFVHHYKIKRGYYHADFTFITADPKQIERGQLTRTYVKYLENCIRKKPSNYLWSHRRWKQEFREEFRKNYFE